MRGDPYMIEKPDGWYVMVEGEDGHAGPTTKEKAEAILAEAMIAVRNFDNSNIQ